MRPSSKIAIVLISALAVPFLRSSALSSPSAYAFEPLPLTRLVCQEAKEAAALIELDNQLLSESLAAGDRESLLAAIDNSLAYLETPGSVDDYKNYSVSGVTHNRVQRSLVRFRTLLLESKSPAELQAAIADDFTFYQSIGQDEVGTVAFTGYFEPTYAASLTKTDEYKYPLYKSPPNLETWPEPHPTRLELEGANGLQADQGPLKGLELVWLNSRLDAFLTQVQGSARLQLTDGSTLSVGYDGRTEYPYTSMGRALIDDGIIPEDELSLPVLLDYFEQNPEALDRYLPRNDRFIFFRETNGAPATGSLGFPVTAGRSIATDKSVMPPGALALINLNLPQVNSTGEIEAQPASRFVLDQDTGGAIKGAGRVDIFIGTGIEAGEVAGLINDTGTLYYLLLKE